MVKKKVYVAFDFDDLEVKQNLVAQSKLADCPFDLIDCSIDKPAKTDWPVVARQRIAECECMIVLCGKQTHQASGVATEIQIAQDLGKRYFLLAATRQVTPTAPDHVRKTDNIWTWRWATVVTLLEGRTPPLDAAVRVW